MTEDSWINSHSLTPLHRNTHAIIRAMTNPLLSTAPSAWHVLVAREGGKPQIYATYDNYKHVMRTVRAIKGPPLEVTVVALYPLATNEELK